MHIDMFYSSITLLFTTLREFRMTQANLTRIPKYLEQPSRISRECGRRYWIISAAAAAAAAAAAVHHKSIKYPRDDRIRGICRIGWKASLGLNDPDARYLSLEWTREFIRFNRVNLTDVVFKSDIQIDHDINLHIFNKVPVLHFQLTSPFSVNSTKWWVSAVRTVKDTNSWCTWKLII